jgi:SPX domain protein involved in polyphosphate accumulation
MTNRSSLDIAANYRYERKFLISDLPKKDVVTIVKLNSYMFNEIFKYRMINNIYFDTNNLQNYYDNVEGGKDRVKVRIRWYGSLFGHIEKPILEIKIKNGLLGTKKSIKLSSFNFSTETDLSNLLQDIKNTAVVKGFNLQSLKPTLLNRYSRNYYLSSDGNYRITIDDNQSFYKIWNYNNSFLNMVKDDKSVILELKYNQEFDSKANNITSKFPFRLSKNSKYVTGIEKFYY